MNLYIDESGTITKCNPYNNKFFVITILIPKDKEKLKRVYKRFISKHFNELKECDKENKMFSRETGKFNEIKGYCLNDKLKLDFLNFFCKNNLFNVRYIILDNKSTLNKFIENKARTFNYLLKLFIINSIKNNFITDKILNFHIDERNIKTDAKFSLEDYLNTELNLEEDLHLEITTEYYDSCDNKLIQIADVFSNIMYTRLNTKKFDKELKELKNKGYILPNFYFPNRWNNIFKSA